MTAIYCLESETGTVVKLDRDVLRSVRSRSETTEFVQGLWNLMPRTDDSGTNPEQLANVRKHVRNGDVIGAKRAIDVCQDNESETLNLRGVVSELEGDLISAASAYQSALAQDPLCSAAQFNLRRCYELRTFGRSDVRLCL